MNMMVSNANTNGEFEFVGTSDIPNGRRGKVALINSKRRNEIVSLFSDKPEGTWLNIEQLGYKVKQAQTVKNSFKDTGLTVKTGTRNGVKLAFIGKPESK